MRQRETRQGVWNNEKEELNKPVYSLSDNYFQLFIQPGVHAMPPTLCSSNVSPCELRFNERFNYGIKY